MRQAARGALLLLGLALAACSSPSPTPSSTPTSLTLSPVLVNTDLAVGPNRIAFALLDTTSAPVEAAAARLTLGYVEGTTLVPHATAEAVFRPWPVGRGVFTARVDLPRAGQWVAEVAPLDGEHAAELGRTVFQVKEQSDTPPLGSPAPRTVHRTAASVADLSELTSDPNPDRDLYALTIAGALDTGLPLVVTFATPAFCTTRTCGPQVDVVKALKASFSGQAHFLHIEIYENPKEMEGDLSRGKIAPAVDQWGLPSDPWTFVVSREGRVAAKFEGFATYLELAEALGEVIRG